MLHGGKKGGAENMKTGKERDWNKYKIAAKRRKLEESAKSSIDLVILFYEE